MSLVGCMSFSDKPMRPVRDSILRQNPEITLEKEMAITMGNGLFHLLDVITLNDADLSEIDSVQVAVYRVYGLNNKVRLDSETFANSLLEKDADLYWEQIVRVRDEGENVWIFAGMDLGKNSLEAISVFVQEQDELVLINIDGDMDEMVEYALNSANGHRNKHDYREEAG